MKSPIEFIGPGQCPFCGSGIIICETEANMIILDNDGLPIDVTNLDCDCKGYCTSCNEKFNMERKGLFYTIKSNIKKKNNSNNPFGYKEEE